MNLSLQHKRYSKCFPLSLSQRYRPSVLSLQFFHATNPRHPKKELAHFQVQSLSWVKFLSLSNLHLKLSLNYLNSFFFLSKVLPSIFAYISSPVRPFSYTGNTYLYWLFPQMTNKLKPSLSWQSIRGKISSLLLLKILAFSLFFCHQTSLFFHFQRHANSLFPALVRYIWHTTWCKFKVYEMLIWHIYKLQNH